MVVVGVLQVPVADATVLMVRLRLLMVLRLLPLVHLVRLLRLLLVRMHRLLQPLWLLSLRLCLCLHLLLHVGVSLLLPRVWLPPPLHLMLL